MTDSARVWHPSPPPLRTVARRGGIDVRCSAKHQTAKDEGSVNQKTFVYDGDDPTLQVWEHDGATDERDADQSIEIRDLDVDAEGLPTTTSLGALPPPQHTDEVFEGEVRFVSDGNWESYPPPPPLLNEALVRGFDFDEILPPPEDTRSEAQVEADRRKAKAATKADRTQETAQAAVELYTWTEQVSSMARKRRKPRRHMEEAPSIHTSHIRTLADPNPIEP